MLTPEMLTDLKAELTNDPTGRGYGGKIAEEQAALFNEPYTVMVPQPAPARVSQVLTQPFAPNVVTASDITAALGS